MVGVVADVGLENGRLVPADDAAAIDEIPGEVPDFGNMSVPGNGMAVRQEKPRESPGIFIQGRGQLV